MARRYRGFPHLAAKRRPEMAATKGKIATWVAAWLVQTVFLALVLVVGSPVGVAAALPFEGVGVSDLDGDILVGPIGVPSPHLRWGIGESCGEQAHGPPLAPKGTRLVVGGGRADGFPALKPDDVSLNKDPDAKPDVVGDIGRAPFEDDEFESVYFERVPYDMLTGREPPPALTEAYRVLKSGGNIEILTGDAAPADAISENMSDSGFTGVTSQYVPSAGGGTALRLTGTKP